jgi:hypothetical protein
MPKKVSNGIQYERDMYAPVKAYLQSLGWEVRSEVEHCDAAALREDKLLMAEMKLTLNLDVILQAVGRQSMADVVYIAVPRKPGAMRSQRWRDTLTLLKRLNLGLLVVSAAGGTQDVEELIEPTMAGGIAARGRAVYKRSRTVRELKGRSGDYNTGGVHRQKLVTAYREAALRLVAKLAQSGPMSAKQLKPEGEKSKGTYTILKNNHYNWFKPVGKGLFDLTDEGKLGLRTYGEVVGNAVSALPDEDVFAGTVEDL